MSYKWILEPYSGAKSRYKCPNCGRSKSFTRYIDAWLYGDKKAATHTIAYADADCGKCNFTSCGYHKYPDKEAKRNTVEYRREEPKYFYTRENVARFRNNWQESELIRFLSGILDTERLAEICKQYCVGYIPNGTVRKEQFERGTLFWQIDEKLNIHRGKVMFYKADGHRAKTSDESGAIMAMWQILHRRKENEPPLCYFGQHLLKINEGKPVGIVESEKTAIIAAYFIPELVWMATNSIQNFNTERLAWLNDYNVPVVVYPDYDGYKLWQEKVESVKRFFPSSKIIVSNFVRDHGGDKDDLADILLRSL